MIKNFWCFYNTYKFTVLFFYDDLTSSKLSLGEKFNFFKKIWMCNNDLVIFFYGKVIFRVV